MTVKTGMIIQLTGTVNLENLGFASDMDFGPGTKFHVTGINRSVDTVFLQEINAQDPNDNSIRYAGDIEELEANCREVSRWKKITRN